jgi:hypothetical protein
MPDIQHFDAVLLCGGTAAKHFAPYLARSGKRTAVVGSPFWTTKLIYPDAQEIVFSNLWR